MNKELESLLKKLNKELDKFLEKNANDLTKTFEKRLEEALNEKCKISVETNGGGKCKIATEGTRLGILVNLVGLENSLLNDLNVPTEMWDMIKKAVSTERSK